jgi:fructose-1,6-bisphosphatase/inositol monophosphatase family enzyme
MTAEYTLLSTIRRIHAHIRDAVVSACEQSALEQMAHVDGEEGGDTIFAIDRVSEAILVAQFEAIGMHMRFRLVAEGLGSTGVRDFPAGVQPDELQYVIIVDPIDGTRGLMYQKRAAWILTGVAPYHGAATNLSDITLAVMTEIPLVKQHLCDQYWAIAGEGAHAVRYNRITGVESALPVRPSQASTIEQGFGNVARFFPGERARLAAVDDMVVTTLLGAPPAGKALCFEDQYISTGGQFAELLAGHDRWIADVRPLLLAPRDRVKHTVMLCCHPYDVCTELIAREAGVIVCQANGAPLDAPLDVDSPVSWVAFANAHLATSILPALQHALRQHDMELEVPHGLA